MVFDIKRVVADTVSTDKHTKRGVDQMAKTVRRETMTIEDVDGSVSIPTVQKERLDALARVLVGRHLQVSVPDQAARDCLLPKVTGPAGMGKVPYLYEEASGTATRVILLVGAGASSPLLKRADDLAEQLVRDAELDPQGFAAARERLHQLYGLAPDTFETILAAFSRTPYTEQKARSVLSDTHSVRYPALLGYELVAHLLKHRFVDAVVNFNFDELLDQSIEDELGRDEYVRILSARDCHGVEFNPGDPSYRPLYIKPHGTASEPESLRFTVESYFDGSRRVRDGMHALFGSGDCVLISFGFGMTGPAFLKLLSETRAARLRIFNLSYSPINDAGPTYSQLIRQGLREGGDLSFETQVIRHRKRPATVAQGWEVHPARKPSSDKWPMPQQEASIQMLLLAEAVRRVASHTGGLVAFRSATRHLAMSAGLNTRTKPLPEHSAGSPDLIWYLRDRTILELAFAMVQSRGFASLERLSMDRCGSYFERYRAAGGRDRWQELCAAIHVVPTPASDSTFWVREKLREKPSLSGSPSPAGFREEELARIDPKKMATVVRHALRKPAADLVGALSSTLGAAQDGTEVEIHSYDDRVCSKLFRKPVTLPTLTAMSSATRELFLKRKGTVPLHFVLTAESGEWFLDSLREPDSYLRQWLKDAAKQGRDVAVHLTLVSAERQFLEELRQECAKRGKKAGVTFSFAACHMDWWDHNRHATVACIDDLPAAGIYFARRLRGLFITPVVLHNPRDAEIVYRHQVRMVDVCFRAAWDSVVQEGIGLPKGYHDQVQAVRQQWLDARERWPKMPPAALVHEVVAATWELQEEERKQQEARRKKKKKKATVTAR